MKIFVLFILQLLFLQAFGQGELTAGNAKVSWTTDQAAGKITITMTYTTNNWIAIGFNPSGPTMTGMDTYMGVVQNGQGTIRDYYATGQSTPTADTQNDATLVSATQNNGVTTIVFSRPLTTNDARDYQIKDENINVMWAIGPGTNVATQHATKGSWASVNLITGGGGVSVNAVTPGIVIHYFCMIIAWPISAAGGMIVSRHAKPVPFGKLTWFPIHIGLQLTALIATIVGLIAIWGAIGVRLRNFHAVIGIIVVIFCIFEAIFGLVAHKLWIPGKIGWADHLHHWLGRLTMVLAAFNLFFGVRQLSQRAGRVLGGGWATLVIWLLVALVVHIVAEIWSRKGAAQQAPPPSEGVVDGKEAEKAAAQHGSTPFKLWHILLFILLPAAFGFVFLFVLFGTAA